MLITSRASRSLLIFDIIQHMYAVVKIANKQYLVNEGQTLLIDKIDKNANDMLELGEVLLTANADDVKIGQPLVKGAKVKAKVLRQLKGDKIRVARFKSKVRYRRVKGFRPLLTEILIEKITGTGEQTEKPTITEAKKPVKQISQNPLKKNNPTKP